MSTLAEIEAAVETLPRREQRRLFLFLAKRLAPAAKATTQTRPTLHERMQAGCGIVRSGLSDLATNKKYLENFGRCCL